MNWIDPTRQKFILLALVAVHALAFLSFYPEIITVSDEMSYVLQTRLLAEGTNEEIVFDPFTGKYVHTGRKTLYPLGTALFALPFFKAGGWQFVFWMPFLALLAALWATANWLKEEGRGPLFAAVLLAYPHTIVYSRLCMSEMPSLLLVSAGLLCFWRGLDRNRMIYWSAAGFVAGLSILVREGNALLFAPFFLGALLRRDAKWWILLLSGIAGVGARLVAHALYLDDALYTRSPLAFGLDYIAANIGFYTVVLTLLVPGGLFLGLLYRGRRRPEIIGAIATFFVFHLLYSFSGEQSGVLKSLVIGPRFFIALLPLLAFAMAESGPRLWAAAKSKWAAGSGRLDSLGRRILWAWLGAVTLGVFAVHVGHHSWAAGRVEIRDAIYAHTPDGAIVVNDMRASGKFFDAIYGNRISLSRHWIDLKKAATLIRRNGSLFIVQLDRNESPFWQQVTRENDDYLASYRPPPHLVLDRRFSDTERLRIWEVTHVPSAGGPLRKPH